MRITKGQNLQLPSTNGFPPAVQAIYSSLFTDSPVNYSRNELIKLVFVKSNPKLLKKMRELIQITLDHIFQQVKGKKVLLSHELLVSHILSYLPFFGVEEEEGFAIPIKKDSVWKMAPYKVEKIYLTPKKFASPIVAIGLLSEDAPPLLLFKGTSYPTDEGFALGVLTDFNPLASVGSYAFYFGKKKIGTWLKDKKARIFGLSLGGTLALRTVAEFPEFVEEVFAFNPPALFSKDLRNWRKGPVVNVICHDHDIVPKVGYRWGKGWNVYKIFLNHKKSFIPAHFKCYVARNHFVIKSDRKKDERKPIRLLVATIHQLLSIILFPLAVVVYIVYQLTTLLKHLALSKKNNLFK